MLTKRLFLHGIVPLSLVVFTGCIKASTKGSLDSFKADSGNAWEYLVERTLNLDTVQSGFSSGYGSMAGSGSASMDGAMPGSSAAFASSMESVGVCYWYARIEKAGPLDFGYNLDLGDGTPNLGVRNNLIARAGVPMTAQAVRMSDVLQAMHDAGGELKRMEGEISGAAAKLHKVLWDAAVPALTGVGAGTVALGALSPQGQDQMRKMAAGVTGAINKVASRGASSQVSNSSGFAFAEAARKTQSFVTRDGAVRSLTTYRWGVKPGDQRVLQVMLTPDNTFSAYRLTKPGDVLARNYQWSRLSENAIRQLQIPAKELDVDSIFKRPGRQLAAAGLGIRKGTVKIAALGKAGIKTVANVCTGKAWHRAACLGAIGTFTAGVHAWNKNSRATSDRVNDAAIAQTVQSVLSNPGVVQEFGQIMQQFEKQKNVSPKLLEALRKQLIAKSATSNLGNCTEIFGTEILTTPGVNSTGSSGTSSAGIGSVGAFGPPSNSSGLDSGLSDPSSFPGLTSLPATPATSMSGIPTFSEDDGLTPTSSTGTDGFSDEGTQESIPEPIPADVFASDTSASSSGSEVFDSSLDSSTGGDATGF
jgi:hypothetical protein